MTAITVRVEGGKVKVQVENQDLRLLGGQIRTLLNGIDVSSQKGKELLDVLDYALGALYALMCAMALVCEDRQEPYAPERYLEESLLPRATDMHSGWLRIEGKWAAGLHFNSALVRMDAVHERAENLAGMKQSTRKKTRPSIGGEPAWCADKDAHKHLIKVYQEVGRLKHKPLATASGRKVEIAEAVEAFRELVNLLETVVGPCI